jgi:hypothetical protein
LAYKSSHKLFGHQFFPQRIINNDEAAAAAAAQGQNPTWSYMKNLNKLESVE